MKKIQLFVGILVSIILVYFVVKGINFVDVWKVIISLNYLILIPAVIIQILSYWVRSMRWAIILKNIKKVRVNNLFPVICISYMANNLLPLRIGEFVRAYLMGKKEKISATAVFSTVILERIYDGITLLLFLGVTAIVYPFPNWVKQIGLVTTLFFFCALGFIFCLVLFKERTIAFINLFTKYLPSNYNKSIKGIIEKFIDGFDIIKNKKNFVPIAVYSIVIWSMEACLFYALAKAFDFNGAIYLAFFTLVVVNLGIMIPSSPGYVGTFEYFITKALSVFGITKEISLSYALVLRVFQYLPITIIGFLFLLKEGISITQLTKMSEVENGREA
ncbi:lysylphosphatidylglycerol synthase transmembrane domain-containing protein [Paenibacillus filicis]|uniref:Phosphatidylglycerol lysyltransferase n=1 Tax=Paenibacillus gyeongsangnamensis TaxID=3388067 RepID=A0ABT4Q6R9_9BACL|nr:lysylphosphatidylglycerol synthase transmembrane domain-containing protein [Paenibacillus filicis]MCZ8512558.1 lysylphosphatidylglycerol synthase transmembrane domain-containing protein [Paenibacillus filicis]